MSIRASDKKTPPTRFWLFLVGVLVVAALAMYFSRKAEAAPNNGVLTWTLPTQNTDGTALPPAQITGFLARWGICTATNTMPATVAGSAVASGPVTTYTTPTLAAGAWCFDLATQANGQQSVFTSAVSKVILPPVPGTPAGLAVQ